MAALRSAFVLGALLAVASTGVNAFLEPAQPPAAQPGAAVELLRVMPVKGKAPKIRDPRSHFGQEYADTNRDGCDTRNQALQRDLRAVTIKPGTRGCVVTTGVLDDPYSGQAGIPYRAKARSPIDFEHIVSMGNATQTGAMDLTAREREAFANDPLNVVMVSARHNRAKHEADASGWLPPLKSYRCEYVARQLAVKHRYRLWLTVPERDAMQRVLDTCPGQPLPSDLEVAFPALGRP